MTMKPTLRQALALSMTLASLLAAPQIARADEANETSPAIAAKMLLRGNANGLKVSEMRITRKNDVLVVQADLLNTGAKNVMAFHRFRWLDASGNQVGDGESWKQTPVMGQQQLTVKSVAPSAAAVDLKLEMNVEKQ